VTVRNFKITSYGTTNSVAVAEGERNVLLEDGEVEGATSSGITGEGFTARRIHVHDVGADAFHLNDDGYVTIEDCYITAVGYIEGTHADGVQVAAGLDITIRDNYFYMPASDTTHENSQVFLIKPDFGPIENLLIENNWLDGGGYTVNMAGASTNVRIRNNRFGRSSNFGPLRVVAGTMVCGNVWDDTGAALDDQTLDICADADTLAPAAPTLVRVE
jgi:hypothetical protein